MNRLPAIVATASLLAAPCFGADLAEARRVLGAQPAQALAMARAALEAEPHDLEAHVLAVKALRLMGRLDEAIAPLEAWSVETPGDFRPLWVLLDVRAGMKNWPAVATLVERAPLEPDDERRTFLRAIVLAQLEHERYADAIATLSVTPPAGSADAADDLFSALAASAVGDGPRAVSALTRYLTSGIDDATQDRVLWWTAELARLAGLRWTGEGAVEGGVVGQDSEVPRLPVGDVVLPVLVRRGSPEYPMRARAERLEGKVTVQTVVLTTGHAAFPDVLATTSRIFEESSRRAAVRWRWKPARWQGRPVAVYYTIVFSFRL